jgi:hypothetical protein
MAVFGNSMMVFSAESALETDYVSSIFAYYKYDTDFNDSVNGLNPTVNNGVTLDSTGLKVGVKSARFIDHDFLVIPHNDKFSFTDQNEIADPNLRKDKPFTICFYAKVTNDVSHWFINKRGAPENLEWQITQHFNTLRFMLFDEEQSIVENGISTEVSLLQYELGETLPINQWLFISCMYNPINLQIETRIDLALPDNPTLENRNNYNRMTSSNEDVVIGQASWLRTSQNYFDLNGSIAVLAFFDKALDLSELTEIKDKWDSNEHLI